MPSAPARRSSANGTSGAQEWTTSRPPRSRRRGRRAACPRRPAGRRPGRCGSRSRTGPGRSRTAVREGSSSWRTTSAPGIRRRTSARCPRSPSASEAGQVAAGPRVAEHGLAAAQFQAGGQRPRADGLDLERAVVPLGELLQGVEVLAQPGAGAAGVAARPVADPPAAGLDVRRTSRRAVRWSGRSCRRRARARAAPPGTACPAVGEGPGDGLRRLPARLPRASTRSRSRGHPLNLLFSLTPEAYGPPRALGVRGAPGSAAGNGFRGQRPGGP